jgi:hypothetical protein
MCLGRGMKVLIDTEMNLDAICFEPAATPLGKVMRFGHFGKTEYISIELSRLLLQASWHRKLNVVDTDDWHLVSRLKLLILPANHPYSILSLPRHGQLDLVEAGGDQPRIVVALLEAHRDVSLSDYHGGDCVDEVAEDMLGLGGRVAVADPLAEDAMPWIDNRPAGGATPLTILSCGDLNAVTVGIQHDAFVVAVTRATGTV